MSLTYVYCLVRASRPPSLRRAPACVPGSSDLRLLGVSETFKKAGHWLVVSSVPDEAYGESARESGLQDIEWVGPRALAHEGVIEHFLGERAVLPMKLFTIFTSDARATEDVRASSRRIARILDRIDGHVEWGVRLIWNPSAREQGHPVGRPLAGRQPARSASSSGTDYLSAKRDLRDRNQADFRRARGEAGRLYRTVTKKATKSVRHVAMEQNQGSRLLLDAAFLVRARNAKAFAAAVRRQTRPLEKKGMTLSLTGPWPAYNFV